TDTATPMSEALAPAAPRTVVLDPDPMSEISRRAERLRSEAADAGAVLYPCGFCRKVFKFKYEYERHAKIHSGDRPWSCNQCYKTFSRKDNMRAHMKIHTGELVRHECGVCGKSYGRKYDLQCGYAKCPVCKQYDETATHECFVTPPKAKESSAPYVYYDFETYVDSGKQHRVHLVTAATSCEACPKLFPRPRCSACGGLHSSANCIAGRDLALDFTSCVSHNDCACGMREFVSVGPHSIDAFYCWLTSVFKQGAIAIAHNGSAYDAFLLLGALLNGLAKKKPQVIFQNSRLMYMKCDKITFKDSLNFIPIGLAQFPKALGLGTQLTKGDFPHVFNQPQNWGYVGPYCSIDMYGGKKNKQHDSIADWLAKQEGQVFNFNKAYLDYCLQDTLILREGCLKYARLIKDICGLDAFVQSNTIAGLAMSVFTTKFMEPNTLGDEGAPVQQPIRLEDALFGGRTEAFVPHAEATETVELRYRDVVSLYPTVNKFDKYPLKAESSGSPGMAEDAKAAYMASFFEREGVRLEKVEENPGLRFVAKIFLNSLWGKFCQRDDLTSTEIVDSYEAWLQRLTDPSIKVKSCEPIGESFMMLEYKPRFGGAGERAFKYANVPIGVFTTSHARLRLYEALEGLGTRVIYADTDSVVYRCSPGEYEPPGGSSLGQWTDEVPAGCRMVQFTTGGPKLYRYVVEKPDGSLYSVLKCKGIRVTPEISEREDELQEILRHGGTVRLPQAQFRRDKASCTIRTLEMDKTFQRVMTKRAGPPATLPDPQAGPPATLPDPQAGPPPQSRVGFTNPTRISNWQVHERVHSGERPFQCASCGRSFISTSRLRAHQLIHCKNIYLPRHVRNKGSLHHQQQLCLLPPALPPPQTPQPSSTPSLSSLASPLPSSLPPTAGE
uniref:DNA-directed DNA polymerase n=1 Tax=Macrostomum lignano TaxID=282301 RepID=A0A1I8JFC1_9PLAT